MFGHEWNDVNKSEYVSNVYLTHALVLISVLSLAKVYASFVQLVPLTLKHVHSHCSDHFWFLNMSGDFR